MTEYMDECDALRPAKNYHQSAVYYILETFCSNPSLLHMKFDGFVNKNGENVLQVLFDMSPVKLRMYGSAEELAENLKIFMGFPASHRYLGLEHEPYVMTPIIYENLKNEKFICKLDLFPVLQSMLARSFPAENPIGVMLTVIPLLKFEEKRLNGQPEFVRFDQNVLDEIWKEIQNAQMEIRRRYRDAKSISKSLKLTNQLNVTDVLEKLQDYVPNNWTSEEITYIFSFFAPMFQDFRRENPCNASGMITMIFVEAKILCDTFQKVIDERPELFRLYSETKKGPITVRMFEDAGHQFVMKMELFNALSESGTVQIDYTDREDMFDTMKMEEILEKYGDEIKNIEFIRYPIMRAKHRAVPVNGPNSANLNNFAILAVDVLLETLRCIIMEYQRFQKFQHEGGYYWDSLSDSFKYFFKETESPYFIACHLADIIRNPMKDVMDLESIPAKNIRNAKKDGFTLQNLKNELAHLNLIVAFPEIQNFAEVVYEHVDKVKKERFLRTCDLIDAIEQCQLICIFERMPHLKKFLHNQGGCGRVVGLKCAMCMDQEKTSEVQEPQKLQSPDSTMSSIESNTPNSLTSSEPLNEMKEKLLKLEQELLQKTQENQELNVANIKLTAENELKSEMIEKLMDKLSIGSSSKSSVTVVEKPITCIICQGEIEGQMTIDCPLCGTKFHKKCALQYGKHQTKCSACHKEIAKFIC